MSAEPVQPEWWTVEEFAEYMRVTTRAARAMINRNQVPIKAITRIVRRIRIRVRIIKEWMERGAA